MLLGDILAASLAGMVEEVKDTIDARILAGLYSAELCECDVATLRSLPEHEVIHRLRSFSSIGVLSHRLRNNMNYYHLESEKVRNNIKMLFRITDQMSQSQLKNK